MNAAQILDRLIRQADIISGLACLNLIAAWGAVLIVKRRDRA